MLRAATGKVGFAAAGIALIAAARYQWKVGGALRYVAPVSLALLGIAMQLIFIDAATLAHRITGPAFVLWLIVVGAMLVLGRTERLFTDFAGRASTLGGRRIAPNRPNRLQSSSIHPNRRKLTRPLASNATPSATSSSRWSWLPCPLLRGLTIPL